MKKNQQMIHTGGVKEIDGPLTLISESIPNIRVKGKLFLNDDKIDKLTLIGDLTYDDTKIENAKIIGQVIGMNGYFYKLDLIGSMITTKTRIIDADIKGKLVSKNMSVISEINIVDGPIKLVDCKINKLITNSRKIDIIDSDIGSVHIISSLDDFNLEPFKIFISGKSNITEIMAIGTNIIVKTIGSDVKILRTVNTEVKIQRIEKPNYTKVVAHEYNSETMN